MDPQRMLQRLRDDDDRWDGIDYASRASTPAPRRLAWRSVSITVAAACALGIAAVVGFTAIGAPQTPTTGASPSVLPSESPSVSPSVLPSPAPSTEDGAQLDAEITREAALFPRPLPTGVEFPTPMYKSSSGTYPIGRGATMAASIWVCIWEREYVSAFDAGDETAKQQAMNELDGFGSLPINSAVLKDWPQQYQSLVVPAKAGNIAPMRSATSNGQCPMLGQ
jgi:hypothetical protein